MTNRVTHYLEEAAKKAPNKIAFASQEEELTFLELKVKAQTIGTFLIEKKYVAQRVALWHEKSPMVMAAFLGISYARSSYVPLEPHLPAPRVLDILTTLKPSVLLCDDVHYHKAIEMNVPCPVYPISRVLNTSCDLTLLSVELSKHRESDPLYIVYTSGSTGDPKGVMVSHRSVIDYTDQLCKVLNISQSTVFGSQAPHFLDAFLKEAYTTLKVCATTYFMPKASLSFPLKAFEFIEHHGINTLCWTVSALMQWLHTKALTVHVPRGLETIAFGGEVFLRKQFLELAAFFPKVTFYNLYGPTEATGMSCYFPLAELKETDDRIPIGYPFQHARIYLIDEDGNKGQHGEVYIGGTGVAIGYVDDPVRTSEAFLSYPFTGAPIERVYKTGDFAKRDDEGRLFYTGRIDGQMKHRGYRLEQAALEGLVCGIEGVENAIVWKENDHLILVYKGEEVPSTVKRYLKCILPQYAVMDIIVRRENWPLTTSGKTHRQRIMEEYHHGKTHDHS